MKEEIVTKTIESLRFPLTVGIVFIHFSLADGLNIHGVSHGLDNPDWFFNIVNLISEVVARICVPLFFMISGFLFFYKVRFDKDIYIRKLKSRVRTLLIPFLIWNAIAIAWQLKGNLPIVSGFYHPMEVHITFNRVFNTFFCNSGNAGIIVSSASTGDNFQEVYPINVPLWYVRDLMMLVVISPVVYWMIKKIEMLFLMALCLIWFVGPRISVGGVFLVQYTSLCSFFPAEPSLV